MQRAILLGGPAEPQWHQAFVGAPFFAGFFNANVLNAGGLWGQLRRSRERLHSSLWQVARLQRRRRSAAASLPRRLQQGAPQAAGNAQTAQIWQLALEAGGLATAAASRLCCRILRRMRVRPATARVCVCVLAVNVSLLSGAACAIVEV